jgi:hypothetical protein
MHDGDFRIEDDGTFRYTDPQGTIHPPLIGLDEEQFFSLNYTLRKEARAAILRLHAIRQLGHGMGAAWANIIPDWEPKGLIPQPAISHWDRARRWFEEMNPAECAVFCDAFVSGAQSEAIKSPFGVKYVATGPWAIIDPTDNVEAEARAKIDTAMPT